MRNQLILEASLDGNPFFKKSIRSLGTQDGEEMFPEIFEITTCSQLREYEDLNDFTLAITGYMLDSLDPFDLLLITAASEENILRWSLEIRLNGNEISLRTIDWKNGQCVYRHEDTDSDFK